jgi:hypothetical protein
VTADGQDLYGRSKYFIKRIDEKDDAVVLTRACRPSLVSGLASCFRFRKLQLRRKKLDQAGWAMMKTSRSQHISYHISYVCLVSGQQCRQVDDNMNRDQSVHYLADKYTVQYPSLRILFILSHTQPQRLNNITFPCFPHLSDYMPLSTTRRHRKGIINFAECRFIQAHSRYLEGHLLA